MYANISRSGSSSTGTPQQQQQSATTAAPTMPPSSQGQSLSLPGSAEMDGRPSTRRGPRPGTTSSQSQAMENENGSGSNASTGDDVSHSNPPPPLPPQRRGTVDVWTRDMANSGMAANARRDSNQSGESAAEKHKESYPELSEPDEHNYSSEPFDEEDEEDEEEEEGSEEKKSSSSNGDQDEFSRKLHEMASLRTRSLHESLESAIKRDAAVISADPSVAAQIPLSPIAGSHPNTSSSRGSSINGHHSLADGNGRSSNSRGTPFANGGRLSKENGGKLAPSMDGFPKTLSSTTAREGGEKEGGSSNDSPGSAGTRVKEPNASIGRHRIRMEGDDDGNKANENGHVEEPMRRLAVSRDGQNRTGAGMSAGLQEIGKVPLGFGSSSARNCLISASGRPKKAEVGEKSKEASAQFRQRSASVSANWQEEANSSSTYKAWLRQKMADKKAKEEGEMAKKEAEEKRKKEKRELAEKNFAHWKAENDRKKVEMTAEERRKMEQKAQMEKEKQEEKRRNAQMTFEHWKKSEEEKRRAKVGKKQNEEKRKREKEERKKQQKQEEAEAAFQAWIQEADERKKGQEEREREEKERREEEKEEQAEMRKQIAQEAYGLWTRMKEEERKYQQSLAYRILDFERRANNQNRGSGIIPWIPSSPTVVQTKLIRPPPELAQGRRRTLEKRLVLLPNGRRPSRTQSAKNMPSKNGGEGNRREITKSARSSQRPWR